MRARRVTPTWKRLLVEYVVMVSVYFLVFYLTKDQILPSVVALVLTMVLLRFARPKVRVPTTPPAAK